MTSCTTSVKARHLRPFETLGAHPMALGGVDGVRFAVWAPNARRVSVVGVFNHWDGRRHPMRLRHGVGVWEIFVPHAAPGDAYQFELLGADGQVLPLEGRPLCPRCAAAARTPRAWWRRMPPAARLPAA